MKYFGLIYLIRNRGIFLLVISSLAFVICPLFLDVFAQGARPSSVASVVRERRVALVIGNGDYKRAPRLENARNDARDMCLVLGKLGFEADCYENLRTKREMKDAVIRFTQKLAGSNVISLVFYAGHGMQVKGENYLIPTDVDLKTEADIDDESLNVGYLMAQLDNSKNSFNMVILDACRNNPMARGWRSSAGRGLASIDAPVGSVIIFSTAPGREASDGVGRNSIFTKHLLSTLPQPKLPLEEMIKQVSRKVTEESAKNGFSQTPWWNSSFTGKFCFAGCNDPEGERDFSRLKEEKDRLELETKRLQRDRDESARQRADAEARIAAMEGQIRQFEARPNTSTSKNETNAKIVSTKKQLDSLREAKIEKDDAQQVKEQELAELKKSREELNRRLAELDKEKASRDRFLQVEKEQGSRNSAPSRTFTVPPAM